MVVSVSMSRRNSFNWLLSSTLTTTYVDTLDDCVDDETQYDRTHVMFWTPLDGLNSRDFYVVVPAVDECVSRSSTLTPRKRTSGEPGRRALSFAQKGVTRRY
jgi:hypothetical protein